MPLPSFLRLLLLAALWGGSFLFMRIVAPVLGAVPTAFGRVALGAAGLLLLLKSLRVPLRFDGKAKAALALGAINSGLPFLDKMACPKRAARLSRERRLRAAGLQSYTNAPDGRAAGALPSCEETGHGRI